jgi:phosphomannomutase/phosphoglucomutase
MHSLKKKGEKVIFGGEGNGGLIFPAHQFCRDGGMTAAAMVSMLASRHKKLSEMVARLPKRYMIKDKVRCTTAQKVLDTLEHAFFHESIGHTDGLRISRGTTWALIRASGTEPLIRIIVESDTRKTADSFYHQLMDVVSKNLPD